MSNNEQFREAYVRTEELTLAAQNQYEQENYEDAAELLLSAVQAQTPAAWIHHNHRRNSYVPNTDRFLQWQRYCRILRERYFQAVTQDKTSLKEMLNNEDDEPSVCRAEAANTLAVLAWDQNKADKAAEYYRKGIHVCQIPIPAEDSSIVIYTEGHNIREYDHHDTRDPIGHLYRLQQQMEQQLKYLEDYKMPFRDSILWGRRLDGTIIPKRTEFTPRCKHVPVELQERTMVGGSRCDACGRSREQVGLVNLHCCMGCARAYYCSVNCQTKQWKRHAPHCRKKREFESGDVLKLDGLKGKPEYNGELVRAMQPINERWSVEILSNKKKISVATRNLQHIRPPA